MFKKSLKVAFAALLFTLTMGAGVAYASHQFTDVPNSSPWHPTVDFIADRGITGGCGGGNYCPSDGVTRGQMSAFLERQARVLSTKVGFETNSFSGASSGDEVCIISGYQTKPYEETATLWSEASVTNNSGSEGSLYAYIKYSTNGGTSWTNVPGSVTAPEQTIQTGDRGAVGSNGALALMPGVVYDFAVELNGSAVVATGSQWCQLLVHVDHRMPNQTVGGFTLGGTQDIATSGTDAGQSLNG